jgi:hypothetical protein
LNRDRAKFVADAATAFDGIALALQTIGDV